MSSFAPASRGGACSRRPRQCFPASALTCRCASLGEKGPRRLGSAAPRQDAVAGTPAPTARPRGRAAMMFPRGFVLAPSRSFVAASAPLVAVRRRARTSITVRSAAAAVLLNPSSSLAAARALPRRATLERALLSLSTSHGLVCHQFEG
jgi:hypothetical protein